MNDEIIFESNSLAIKGYFYNRIWFRKFGKIQHEILECSNIEISVNLEKCLFISPTPFLSLLLTLQKVKDENDCFVKFVLGNEDSDENKKFLNYCAKEGFLDIINSIGDNKYEVSKYKKYNMVGNENYENILNARIIDISNYGENIEQIVNELLEQINESNLHINKKQGLYTNVAIRNILQELIDNVNKHAYCGNFKKFAIYIRTRYVTDTTKRIGRENNIYSKQGPTTKPDEIYIHKAIEIYFQDIGKGIVNSYREKGNRYDKRPLREIVKYTFFRENFPRRENNTSINGLAFLRKILQEKNNYFTVYNQFEGTGTFTVTEKNHINVNNILMKDFDDFQSHGILGQIYNFTLFDREYISDSKEEKLDGLLDVYQQEYRKMDNLVIDLRKNDMCIQGKGTEALLFMPPYITKQVIINKLKLALDEEKGVKTLIISDIKDDELVLFEWALDGLYLETLKKNVKDILAIEEIFLITMSLKVRFFVVCKTKLNKEEMTFEKFNKKYNYLYKVKKYESELLAKFLETDSMGKYILTKGMIEWTDEHRFKGFINFDMLITNDECFRLLKRNLERVLPIIGDKKLYAIDTVTTRIVNAVDWYREDSEKESFGVGSVFVSGTTLQSSDYQGNTIHFFFRGEGPRKPALFFNPIYLFDTDDDTEEDKVYVRVGKSPHIKRKGLDSGNKSINCFLQEKEIYKILHQYTYSSILCGHLNFEKRHDLLSINLNAIMYDENTRLKEYVENMLNYGLAHYTQKRLEHSEYFDSLRNSCMVVYPYNYFTSSILKQCNIDEEYKKYIVGLTPTNIVSLGEDLDYSECFTERICDLINMFKRENPGAEIKVIFFDTLSYSGRTKQEMYEYVNSIEEISPYFVSVIDAKVNHSLKKTNTISYMNVNIPLLGRGDTCKICSALNRLQLFKDNIIDAIILVNIESIQKVWRLRDIRNYKEIIKLPNFERIYANELVKYNESVVDDENGLYFVNALPLYIFVTNRIKKENDFSLLEYILDFYSSNIDIDSMIYLLNLFLWEYGDVIYHSLLKKVCCLLLTDLKECKMTELKQMSVIAFLALKEESVIKIVIDYIKENTNNLQMGNERQIIFMYFLNKAKEELKDDGTIFLFNKMKSGNNRLDLYKQFHCQLKNTNGNIHNSPLMSLIEGQESTENKRLTRASLSLLEHSLNYPELSFDILYEEGRILSDSRDFDASCIKEDCLQNIIECKSMLTEGKNFSRIRELLKAIFDDGQKLHRRLFAPHKVQNNLENRELKSIETLLAERIDNYNMHKGKRFPISFNESYDTLTNVSSNIATIYYIWNAMLVREIDYTLDNVGKFVDEKNAVMIDGEKNAGEVSIKIQLNRFEIYIYNNTNDDIESIRQKAKQRYQKEVLELLGIKFLCYENKKENPNFKENAVVTQISIPNIQSRKEH